MTTALSALASTPTETSDTLFYTYCGFLALSGVVSLIVALLPLRLSLGFRIVSSLIGVAALGYAYYLTFVFEGGDFRFFWYAFVLPFGLVYQAIKNHRSAEA